MMDKKFITEEGIKFFIGLVSTAVGVLIALLINSRVESSREEQAYKIMIKVLNVEANSNEAIFKNSFWPNFKDRIVYGEFSLKNSEEIISNEIFLAHADSELVYIITEYNLNLRRANAFRSAAEKYRYDSLLFNKWGVPLLIPFEKVLQNSNTLIHNIQKQTSKL